MQALPFHIVDVFAVEKYSGNQLAVVRNTAELSSTDMQRIAREINFSETTFIPSREQRDGGYDVRIFTPREEVPFAGHPTLGTAYIIQQEIVGAAVDTVILNLQVGQIPVSFSYHEDQPERLWMKQIQPTFGQRVAAGVVLQVLGLEEDDLDTGFPVEEVSTGLPFIIVPLKTLDSLRRIKVARDRYFELIEDRSAKAILAFCPETISSDNHLCARVFADYYGVPEDPATGSANGCLAAYLVQNRYFGTTQVDVQVEQGYEIDRPSLLFLRAKKGQTEFHISVGGKVVPVARGELV